MGNLSDPYSQDPISPIAKRTGKAIANRALGMLLKKAKKLAFVLIKATAPVWVPLLIILTLTMTAYMIIYAIPREAIEAGTDTTTLSAIFMGVEEEHELIKTNPRLIEEYKIIASRWDEGLTKEQKKQVVAHKFPWSVLLATDRIVNDTAVWEGTEDIKLDPEGVFEALRPRFEWKDSQIITTTERCSTNEEGEVTCTTTTNTENVKLVTRAKTLEGEFVYEYKWQTERAGTSDGGYVEETKEILENVIVPPEYFKPWKDYLATVRRITDKKTLDLIVELSLLYDEEYSFNYSLLKSLDYTDYPLIHGANDWLWPTPSTRVTSPFGPRWGGFHHGVDIGATKAGVVGDPIWSMDDGKVVFSGFAGAYGNVVFVQHKDDVMSVYAHLSRRTVRQGEIVRKGDVIGLMGTTGRSTGVHLHFEIRLGDRRLDPLYFFRT